MKRTRKSNVQPEKKIVANRSTSRKLTPIAKVAPEQQRGDVGEISRTCAVLGCDRYKLLPNHLFFRFPEEKSLRSVWTETTGRTSWTPNDYSYVCAEHFASDCRRRDGTLESGSVPTLQLPAHVMQMEYINEEILDKEVIPKNTKSENDSKVKSPPLPQALTSRQPTKTPPTERLELLKLFSDVQNKQKQMVAVSERLRHDRLVHRLRLSNIEKLKEKILRKEKQIKERKPVKNVQIYTDEPVDKNAMLVLPQRYTDEVRSFALNIYDKSPEAYVYLRNTLRTLLPETQEVERWTSNGFRPATIMTTSDSVRIVTEANERELSCKIAIV